MERMNLFPVTMLNTGSWGETFWLVYPDLSLLLLFWMLTTAFWSYTNQISCSVSCSSLNWLRFLVMPEMLLGRGFKFRYLKLARKWIHSEFSLGDVFSFTRNFLKHFLLWPLQVVNFILSYTVFVPSASKCLAFWVLYSFTFLLVVFIMVKTWVERIHLVYQQSNAKILSRNSITEIKGRKW